MGELKVWRLDNMKFNNEYCIYQGFYFKINKIFEDGTILMRNMSNISSKIKVHKSLVEFVDKEQVPKLFR